MKTEEFCHMCVWVSERCS